MEKYRGVYIPQQAYGLSEQDELTYQDIVEYPCVVPADVLLLAFYGSLAEDDASFLDEK